MTLKLDHITFAGPRLEELTAPFTGLGLVPDYGGPHANGVTHMAQIGFADGSYIEFIAPMTQGARSPIWNEFMAAEAGPCAWCVVVDDAAGEAERLRARSIPVQGPARRGRVRPDGVSLAWDMVFVGDGSPGALYPFLIHDLTDHAWRVPVTEGTLPLGLTGVEAVVIGVPDLAAAGAAFRKAYGFDEPHPVSLPGLEARLARFGGEPLLLAQPQADQDGVLSRRIARHGPVPFAVLVGTRDMELACKGLGLPRPSGEGSRTAVAWLPLGSGLAGQVGLVAAGGLAGGDVRPSSDAAAMADRVQGASHAGH